MNLTVTYIIYFYSLIYLISWMLIKAIWYRWHGIFLMQATTKCDTFAVNLGFNSVSYRRFLLL